MVATFRWSLMIIIILVIVVFGIQRNWACKKVIYF